MFHFTATSVTKSLKVANRVTLAYLYNHNLLFCCSGIETNPLQNVCQCRSVTGVYTAQKIKFSIKAFFSKSARNCGFGHIYWRNPWWKTTFFVQCWMVLLHAILITSHYYKHIFTAWKVSKYGVFLVRIFAHLDQKKLRIWTLFIQWLHSIILIQLA